MILEKLRLFFDVLKKLKNPFAFFGLWLGVGNDKTVRSGKTKAYLRNNKIDYWIFIENILEDTYGLKSLRFLNFDHIVDIGGNIGLFTVSTKKYWPKSKRIVIEPRLSSLSVLKRNLKLNNIKAEILNRAVVEGKAKKYIDLFLNENPAMSSVVSSAGKSIKVKTVNLSDLIPREGRVLVKIDIEGGEYDFFRESLLKVFSRISVLLMETHDLDKRKNHDTVIRFLKNAGFKVYYKNRQITAFNQSKTSF